MNQLPAVKSRVQSIDVLRGIVMIIMALDHVRDFFHNDAFMHDPLNPGTTTVPLYFTRWITHFCAPIFVFLAGTSVYLMGLRKSKQQLSRFLITRGIWLIFIEAAIITLAISFNPFYNSIIFQVIWAIGISMVILGLLVRLPYMAIFIIGLCIVAGHNLLDYPEAARNHEVGFLWDLVHDARFDMYTFAPGYTLIIVYAFLPWTGIMLMGYCIGKFFESTVTTGQRRKILLTTGFVLIALFILLRFINTYGDPVPWTEQQNGVATFLSFLNVNKYPPSLMYACITIGPALILLALFENVKNGFTSFVKIYGRVPFFYYIIHFFLIHALTVVAFYMAGYGNADIITPNFLFFFRPPQFGFDLWFVYVVWIAVVLALYPLCRWYNGYKSMNTQWWLSYL